jgi:hypothetical protein
VEINPDDGAYGMSDAIERRERLVHYSGERGSMVLVTERRKALGALTCEVCNASRVGGIARGVVLDEPAGDTAWLLWMLADGWSQSDHQEMAACPEHQSDPLLKTIRFADGT